MSSIPPCPQCSMENTYPEGDNYVCADCAHEWPAHDESSALSESELLVLDANGNRLSDGDSVVLIKDLKLRGSSTTLKMGTKVKSIRLVDGDHNVDAGSYMLKSCFLKKL